MSLKVVCIGDSITYGQNVKACWAWPALLRLHVQADVRNEGVCGDTTRLALERFPKAVQLHKPDVVTIQFGHNDANCWNTDNGRPRVGSVAYAANILEMVERVQAFGGYALVLRPYAAPGRDAAYNKQLKSHWVRLYDFMNEDRILKPPPVSVLDDGYGLHPDMTMHHAFAKLVGEAINAHTALQ